MTSFFNFKDECKYKYDQEIYDIVMDSFDLFPLACIINNKFLAVHGGISPDLKSVNIILFYFILRLMISKKLIDLMNLLNKDYFVIYYGVILWIMIQDYKSIHSKLMK